MSLILLLVAVCIGLEIMAGRALAYFWMAWREEVRWNQGVAVCRAIMEESWQRRLAKEAGRGAK